MSFLNELSNSLMGQLNLAENTPGDLDGNGTQYGKLGDFAMRIDKSAQRTYIESGTIRNIRPRAMEVLMQEPDITVLVKKRMFASLAENYRIDLMDADERLFIRASKRLFYNKCRAIAAYERLTKIERIVVRDDGVIGDFILPQVFGAIDILDSNPLTSGLIGGETRATLETIRRVKAFSDPNYITTWITDADIPYATDTGEGTGVFELTLVASVTTNTSVEFGTGQASLKIADPYKLMIITKEDIDKAISDATSLYAQNNFFKMSTYDLERSIADLKFRLNQVRLARGVSTISFYVNEETILFKKVRAVVDEEGRDISFVFNAGIFGADLFTFDNSSVNVDPSASEGRNGLVDDEMQLFKQIVQNIYVWVGLKSSTRSETKNFSKQTNNVRKRMWLNYAGKAIIQPMDEVTIFQSSKSITDSKITQGLNTTFSGDTLLNKLNSGIGNLESSLNDLATAFGGAGDSYINVEKNAIAGPNFPTWLWSLMRNDFTRQAAGTCIFSGVVDKPTQSYSTGENGYTLDVTIKDKTAYFKMGQINIQPAADVFNADLYDPLTPYNFDFDLASGSVKNEDSRLPLLEENIKLLNSGSVRSSFGRNRGSSVTAENYANISDIELVSSSMFGGTFSKAVRTAYNNPDGFVYRWKTGIGSLVMFDEQHQNQSSFKKETAQSIYKNPFAQQGIMNVISLLVTGVPYNFDTFLRGALRSNQLSRDETRNLSSSNSFYKSLLQGLSAQNAVWGGFIPFKKLVYNEREYNFVTSGQFSLNYLNTTLQDKVRERAGKFDQMCSLMVETNLKDITGFFTTDAQTQQVINKAQEGQGAAVEALAGQIKALDAEITKYQTDFNKQLNQPINVKQTPGQIVVFGNDISFDPTLEMDNNATTEAERSRDQREFRKKINDLSQRRLWKVKANEDPNLFIVDDTYDKNYDIQAIEQSIATLQAFNSVYSTVFDQIEQVRHLLGLEIFADSQGHIRARPPQYNRMPSSVFYDMLKNRAQKGIQIFPQYLESLFFNKLQGITDQLGITEDKIRINAAALGVLNDTDMQKLLGGTDFKFISDRSTGLVGDSDLRKLIMQDSPDLQEDVNAKALVRLSATLNSSTVAKVNFNIANQVDVAFQSQTFSRSTEDISSVIAVIGERLQARTGATAPTIQSLFSSTRVSTSGRSQTDIVKITEDLAKLVAERQILIKSLAGTIKNLTEGLAVNDPDSGSAETLLYPNINRDEDKVVPELLESMIEDENNDDYGPGSGKRFILTDSKIISFTISEEAPPYTAVQVDGALNLNLIDQPKTTEAQFLSGTGGNAMSTAAAVDYDMWRMYGFKASQPVKAQFFDNPYTQSRPFAVYLLNLARKNIFKGSVTLAGNEFIQPGEVYYLEDMDLLFYAESVQHSFSYNSQYQTQITFSYGHNPGEYIPTWLDIIGQGLYSNQNQSNRIRQNRHDRADDSQPVAALTIDTTVSFTDTAEAISALIGGVYKEQNTKSLANTLLAAQGFLTPSAQGMSAKLEIRTYQNTNSAVNMPENTDLSNIASNIKKWVTNPTKYTSDSKAILPDSNYQPSADMIKKIDVIVVDLNEEVVEARSPSSESWSKARIVASAGQSGGIVEEIDTNIDNISNSKSPEIKKVVGSLVNSVIDIWVVFEDVDALFE